MMVILSSQRHINEEIVNEKIVKLQNETSVTLPIVYVSEYNGDQLYVLLDGHHTAEAARQLGIGVQYAEQDINEIGYDGNMSLDDLLEVLYVDSDWYNYETGYDYF